MRGLLKAHSAYRPAFPIKGRCAGHPHPFAPLRGLRCGFRWPPLIAPAFRRRWGTQTLIALERISG